MSLYFLAKTSHGNKGKVLSLPTCYIIVGMTGYMKYENAVNALHDYNYRKFVDEYSNCHQRRNPYSTRTDNRMKVMTDQTSDKEPGDER